jgi:diacylglycerol kinase (ATP)
METKNMSASDQVSAGAANDVDARFKRVQVVINPVSGKNFPILNTLNTVWAGTGIEWDVSVTHRAGDARRYAEAAVEAGVDAVTVYGGDGTVVETASGLIGSDIPLAILPGGTGNVIAVDLGIPGEVADAASLLTGSDPAIRAVDMGRVGERTFFHLGLGIEGQMIRDADRASKTRQGVLAYMLAALKNLRNPPVSRYRLRLDGEQVEVDGVNLMVTTFGSIGIAGLTLSHQIDMSDGLLDVLVIRNVDLKTLLAAAAGTLTSGEMAGALLQWQVSEVHVEVDPPQELTFDGETAHIESIQAEVIPAALRVLVPPEPSD